MQATDFSPFHHFHLGEKPAMTAAVATAVTPTTVNRNRLFWVAVLGLFTAAVGASLRAGIAGQLKQQVFDGIDAAGSGVLTGEALGASFLGFALTLFCASPFLDLIGMRRMLMVAAGCFIVGSLTVMGAGSIASGLDVFHLVWLGMLLCGIGWGAVEATINPMTTALYPDDKTSRLNMLHAWWPAGLIVGGLASAILGGYGVGWKAMLGLGLVPAVLMLLFSAGSTFPLTERAASGISMRDMFAEILRRPSFLLWFGAMFLTAASELAPGQWVDVALSHRVGMRGILLLVYVSFMMFVLRHFAGLLAHRLGNAGLMWVSSLLAGAGLLLLSRAQSPLAAMLAATVWGGGVCFMWPTMIASVAERYPRGGSWMIGLMGSAGALSIYFVLPSLGGLYDAAKLKLAGGADGLASLSGTALAAVEDQAASSSFAALSLVPAGLLLVFGAIWLWERRARR
jgi:Major Facilitator Superfamily